MTKVWSRSYMHMSKRRLETPYAGRGNAACKKINNKNNIENIQHVMDNAIRKGFCEKSWT